MNLASELGQDVNKKSFNASWAYCIESADAIHRVLLLNDVNTFNTVESEQI